MRRINFFCDQQYVSLMSLFEFGIFLILKFGVFVQWQECLNTNKIGNKEERIITNQPEKERKQE
jgi:hypothetical protein